MLWVLKRTVSMRRFLLAPKTYAKKYGSDFIWDLGKLSFPSHLGKYIIKNGKISTKIHDIGKKRPYLDWE